MKIESALKPYNTFGIDAKADKIIVIEDDRDIARLFPLQKPYYILGGGSNVVFDGDYHGTVVVMRNKGIRLIAMEQSSFTTALDTVLVEAQAGEIWDDFVKYCIAHGWHGTENLVAIPGTVGAAPVQNVGAYGLEAKDLVEEVRAIEISTGEKQSFRNDECHFAYRNSIFKQELSGRYLITSVVFRLSTKFSANTNYVAVANALAERNLALPSAQQLADIIADIRWAKLPRPEDVGSAGSFFKNPIVTNSVYETLRKRHPGIVAHAAGDGFHKLAAGWLIEHAGWKGRSLGPAAVWNKQALVLVNNGGATGRDILRLADAITADVKDKFGVTLEKEAIIL
ncbi:MAG: UDP-N-acetylmuramate dehydrogenase [Bacteroidales bacterium]|nr:UDP-N-acetylmuramate dehydrogenase [Bacteroidales bacterium]